MVPIAEVHLQEAIRPIVVQLLKQVPTDRPLLLLPAEVAVASEVQAVVVRRALPEQELQAVEEDVTKKSKIFKN